MLHKGNQRHHFLLCLWELLSFPFYYGSGTLIYYDSGSAKVHYWIAVQVPLRQKVTDPSVPVLQHCSYLYPIFKKQQTKGTWFRNLPGSPLEAEPVIDGPEDGAVEEVIVPPDLIQIL